MKSIFKGKKIFKVDKDEIVGFENADFINENEVLIVDPDINILKKYQGENTEIDEKLNALKASKKGLLDFQNSKINIRELEIVDDSLDYIYNKKIFSGNLWVSGDILSGLNLVVNGNLQVDGVVENVKIKCNGNVLIKGGFLGQEEGIISCKGNFFAEYIQNGSVKANEVIIGSNMSNSNIVALKGIVVKGQGKIVGGNYYSKDYVIAKEIGSPNIVETNIKIGYNFIKKRELQLLKNKLTNIKIKIDNNEKLFSKYFEDINYSYYEIDLIIKNISDKEKNKNILIKLLENIELKEKFSRLKSLIKNFDFESIANLEAYLKTDIIFPGVEIFILDKSMSVKDKIEKKNMIIRREDIDKWQQF